LLKWMHRRIWTLWGWKVLLMLLKFLYGHDTTSQRKG
jgi:hypothetical protein